MFQFTRPDFTKPNRYQALIRIATETEYAREGIASLYAWPPKRQTFTVVPRIGDLIEFDNVEPLNAVIDMLGADKSKRHNYILEVVSVSAWCCDADDELLYDFSIMCVYKSMTPKANER